MPDLLLIGEFAPGHLGLYYERAFMSLGWTVTRYDAGMHYSLPLPLPASRPLRRVFRGPIWAKMNRQCVRLARTRWDLVLAIKAPFLDAGTVDAFRAESPNTVMIYPDSPWDRWTQRADVLPVLARFHRTYIWSRTLVDRLHGAGVGGGRYLAFGYDPCAFDPAGRLSSGRAADTSPRQRVLVFLGQPHPNRLAWLKALEGLPVRVFGAQWKQSWFGARSSVRVTRTTPMGAQGREIYEQSLAALNIMHEKNLTGHNMRTFEIPPTGALMISSRTEDVEALFPDGIACLASSSIGEFRRKCDRALADPEAALRIGGEGARRVQGHTYAARAQAVLEDLAL
jgi:hypothetical protein